MSAYSRENPSPRAREVIDYYKSMHAGEGVGEERAAKTFDGKSLLPHIAKVRKLAIATRSETLLDYGSGKGAAYFRAGFFKDPSGQYETALEAMHLKTVTCYDPGIPEFSKLPEEKFDGVVCTDVLEHVLEDDVPWVLAEIFSKADKFVFANVACYPAAKTLPSGENAHATIKSATWWRDQISKVPKASGLRYRVELMHKPFRRYNLINKLIPSTAATIIKD